MPSLWALSSTVVVTPAIRPSPSKSHRLSRALASAQQRIPSNAPEPPSPPPLVPIPAAPWMRGPLLVPHDDVLRLSEKKAKHKKSDAPRDANLTAKVRGGRSRYATRRIAQNIARLREMDPEAVEEEGEVKREEWSGERMPWVRAERMDLFRRGKKVREVTEAEVTLERELLERLREKARGMRTWVKAKKRGVTDEVVEGIRQAWKQSELAMVKIVEPLSKNMDRAREIVEEKTGGLVVWSKKDTLVIYRPELAEKDGQSQSSAVFSEDKETTESVIGTLYERETDRLLHGLGPRFIDWWMRKPLPVDADLLPESIPGFKPPIRSWLSHLKATLTDNELTALRNYAQPLPTHFALGKNTKLQGLAAAIIKLWERSLIAKIAVKRGIPHTDDEIMSSELKRLTGGTLILRNKFYIILYRGKDFLPPKVADSILEREAELRNLQFEEEQLRQTETELFCASEDMQLGSSVAGTFKEFQDIQINLSSNQNHHLERVKMQAEKERLEKELKRQKHQLYIIRLKLDKSEEVLAKLNDSWRPSAQAIDQELLTEEERQKFRKIGLKMDEILLLGRRGIYDGVIGSIHLHWRHREIVKIITMQKEFSQILQTAQILENESGGILISIEKYKSGHAIIIFRGKNYVPASRITLVNLPTKREALQRSIEVQRRGSLMFFAHQRERSIWTLERKIELLLSRGNYNQFLCESEHNVAP